MHLADEVLEHFFGNGEVSDHAVFHGANSRDVSGSTAQHALGFSTHSLDFLAPPSWFLTDGDYRRLIQDDSPAAHINQCIGRTQVDGEVVGKVTPEVLEHVWFFREVGKQK